MAIPQAKVKNDMKPLAQAPFNTILEVGALQGDSNITLRLRELGFYPGRKVQIIGQAPFGGPFVVQLNTNVIALRVSEAECLLVI